MSGVPSCELSLISLLDIRLSTACLSLLWLRQLSVSLYLSSTRNKKTGWSRAWVLHGLEGCAVVFLYMHIGWGDPEVVNKSRIGDGGNAEEVTGFERCAQE